MLRWQNLEFIFKGVYLGLLVFVGLLLREADWWKDMAQVGLCTLAGLVVCLSVAAVRKLRQGYRVRGRVGAFVLFLLLENPVLVYAGVLLGTLAGAYSLLTEYSLLGQTTLRDAEVELGRLAWCVGGGVLLGLAFINLRGVQGKQRIYFGFLLGVGIVVGVLYVLPEVMPARSTRVMFATLLLFGIPVFYLLTLAGMVEESEVEIAAMCAALGVSLYVLTEPWFANNSNMQFGILLIPPVLYYLYTRSVLPGLRVFKHVLRGMSYANVGHIRPALVSLGRAMQLDPYNLRAREQLWRVHRMMDLDQVAQDPQTVALINFELCLDRVATLLLGQVTPEKLQEAHRLLRLVSSQRPEMQPRCDYWLAVARTHERRYDEAAAALERVITGEGTTADNPHRQAILFAAWQLAVMLHPELLRRVGTPQLGISGRRMQAIAAVERRLAADANDKGAIELKRVLYQDLTESEYLTQVAEKHAPRDFDHGYVQQLGLELVNHGEHWPRGCEYLRMAAIGLPQHGPTLFLQIAKAHERANNFGEVWQNYELVKKAGQLVGYKNLATEDRTTYFAVLKVLAEDAAKRGDFDAAIENYRLFSDYERAGVETHRILADLHERKGDAWSALQAVERGLCYDKTDADLLQRKDRCYYSVKPEELKTYWEQVKRWFDVAYCKERARVLLEKHGDNLELLDWATHLSDLAQTAEPDSIASKVLRARLLRRRGEVEQTVALLEEVRAARPEKFATNDDEEAWYVANRLLGNEYLETKPDQALVCFQEFRKHGKSGADTVFRMGEAYEKLGDVARAIKCYEVVAAYDAHPLAPEARNKLYQLKSGVQA
jgi:tetratricopeptide (TPR) repeat protein